MSSDRATLVVPDLGDFEEVEVIDVLVTVGDEIAVDDALITLETDKAAMDVPSTQAGKVVEIKVKTGDKVSKGDAIALIDTRTDEAPVGAPLRGATEHSASDVAAHSAAPTAAGEVDIDCEVLVLGAGPGGYTAAFRAADLGRKVVLVERYPALGGVCLNVGCIPSKALLHVARVIEEAAVLDGHGVKFGTPKLESTRLRAYKDGVVGKLTQGLAGLAGQRKVTVVQGRGRFDGANSVVVEGEDGERRIAFEQAIIAVGSSSARLPGVPDDPRIMTSTGALELDGLDERWLVIGGGIIGLEMATVYAGLGARVGVVELTAGLMPGCDRDLVKVLQKRLAARCEDIWLSTKVTGVKAQKNGIKVEFDGPDAPASAIYGRVLVAVGRTPNGGAVDAGKAGVELDERGFVGVDRQMRTNVAHIFAIGDTVAGPMLAHKASHEGKVAAEAASGLKAYFDTTVIPSVAYTDPEVAWCGLTESAAKAQGVKLGKGQFPWSASGRALALDAGDGFSKLLFDEGTGRVVGAGIVGPNAGDLISEAALAIEMGCDAADIGLTVHPHPTLSESVAFAADAYAGTLTDLYLPKKP